MNREKLFNSLRDIYSDSVYDLDNNEHLKKLRKNKWIFEKNKKQINRPDFLVKALKNRVLLIELKKIEEKQSDLDIKKELQKRKEEKFKTPFGWWVEPNRKDLKKHVEQANKQFKGFIKPNSSKFFKNEKLKCNFSTILALHSERIMQRYTLPDIIEDLYGRVKQEYEDNFFTFRYKVEEKLLNIKRYRSIGLIAVWDGNDRFLIYNNLHTLVPNNIPFFLTKKDKSYFILDEYFSVLQGIKILLLQESDFNGNKKFSFLINEIYADKENFFEMLFSEIKFFSRVHKEQREIFNNFFKRRT